MSTSPVTAHSWIAALRKSHERLSSLTATLTPAELAAPSHDPDWSIALVLSHLGSGAEAFTRLLEAALAGRESPGNDVFRRLWQEWDTYSPEVQAYRCSEANGAFLERLE